MTDLRELYQEVILDHSKRPRNLHGMPEASHRAEGANPLRSETWLTVSRSFDCSIARRP